MKHYNFDFAVRRNIRQQIEMASERRQVSLEQNTIENLVTDRLDQMAEEMVGGKVKEPDWDTLVLEASVEEQKARDQWQNEIAPKLAADQFSEDDYE